MTKSSSISRSFFVAAFCLSILFCAVPSRALASVHITAIQYDPQGADQGREWIQITNAGTTSVNLIGYRLYEGGVNHKLTVAAGTSTLAAGAEAIITTDPAQYASDHPSFNGAIFKSSFSLSNTGETIELKDASLKIVDSYSYTAPPVIKEVTPAKAPTTIKKSPVSFSKTSSYSYGSTQAAAAPLAGVPTQEAIPNLWLYGSGLLALLVVGAGATLYAQQAAFSGAATSSPEPEFELE